MKVIAISGSSGFVGTYLKKYFHDKNYEVMTIKREELTQKELLKEKITKADVIINLSGANIIQRWTKKHKKKIYRSRIKSTKALVDAINTNEKEQLFISTSAIGIYENDTACDEDDFLYGQTFLAEVCKDWEKEALKVNKRLVIFRLGVVLGDGGALKKMLLPFKLGLGGVIGDGKQPFSYIHVEDLARAYEHVIYHNKLKGIFNLTTQNPVTNQIFTKTLAKKLHRPAFLPVRVFVLKLVFGEGAQILSDGQCVYPKRLLESGFVFRFETIEKLLDDVV